MIRFRQYKSIGGTQKRSTQLRECYGDALNYKYCILYILMLICCSCLVGCHPGTIVEIFNDTGEDVIITSFDAKLNETRYKVIIGQSVEIGIPYKLEIRLRNGIWRYSGLRLVPGQFQIKLRPNVYLEKFQVEKNGEIYVIPPDAKAVVATVPVQPVYYPIKPQ